MAPHGKKRKKINPENRRESAGVVFVNKGVKYPEREGTRLDGDEEVGPGTPKTHNTPKNVRSQMYAEKENDKRVRENTSKAAEKFHSPPEKEEEKPKKYNSKAVEIIDHAREPKEQEPSPAPKKRKRPASKDSGSDTESVSTANTDQEGKAGKPKGKAKDKPKGKDKSKDKEKDNPEDEAKDKSKDKSKAKGKDKSRKDSKDSEDEAKDKPKDKPKAKGKDKSKKDSKDSEDEAKDKPKDKPKAKGKDKSRKDSKDSEDEAKDKSKDKPKAKGKDKSRKDSKDSEDETKDKSKDKSKAKGKDKSRKDSKDSEDEAKDKSKDKSKAKGKDKSRKDSKDSEDEAKDKSKDRAKNKSKDRTKDKSKDDSKDKSRDSSKEKSKNSSKDRAKGKAKKPVKGKAKDKSEQTTTDQTDNDTDVSSFPSTRDDDSQLTSEQNETATEPALSTDTKNDITKTEDLTGDIEKTEKTEEESAEWTVSTAPTQGAPETTDAGTSTPRTRKHQSEEESVTADVLTENQPSKDDESAETQTSKEDPSAATQLSKEDASVENQPTEGDFSTEIQPSRADASAENQPAETEVSTEIQPSKAYTPPGNQQSVGSYQSVATTSSLKEIRPSSPYTATVEPAQKRSDKVSSGRGSRRPSIQSKKGSVEVIPLKSGSYPLIYTRRLSEETKKENGESSPIHITDSRLGKQTPSASSWSESRKLETYDPQSEVSYFQQTDPSSETKDKSVGPGPGANDSEGPGKEPSISSKKKYTQRKVQENTTPVSNSRYSQRSAPYSERRRQQNTTAYPQSRYYQSRLSYSERKQQYNSTPYPQARYSQSRPPSYERKWQQNPSSHPQARYSQTNLPYYGREQYETVAPYPQRMYTTKNAFDEESSYQRRSPTFSEIRRQPTRNAPSRTGSTEVIPLKSGSYPLILTRRLPKNTEQNSDAPSERNKQGLKQAGRSYTESGYGPTSSSYYRPKSEASEQKIKVSSSKYRGSRDSSVTTWTYRRPKSGSLHSTSLFPDKGKRPSSGGISLHQGRYIDRQSAKKETFKQCAQTCCLQPPNRTAQFSNGTNITTDQGQTPIRSENCLESSVCTSSIAPESCSNPSTHKRSYISGTCSHSSGASQKSNHTTQTKQKRQIIDRDQPGGRKCAYACCPEKLNNEKNLHNNHSEEPYIADLASYRPILGSELFPDNKTGKPETASQGETFQSYCTTADSNSTQKKFGTPAYNTVKTHTRDTANESCKTSTCNKSQASCSSTRSAPNVTCNSINRTKETHSCRMDQSSNVPADRTVVPIHYKPMSMLDPKSPAEDGQTHSQLNSLKEINWDSILRDRKKKFKSNDFREAGQGAQSSYRDRGSKMSKYDDKKPCSCLDTRVRSSSANQNRIPSYGNKLSGLSQQPSRPQRPFLHSGPVSRACPSRSFHYTSESSRQDRSACMESRLPPAPLGGAPSQPCFSNRINDPKTCTQCPSSTIQNRPSTPLRSFQCQESCREPATRTQNSVVGTPINFNSASVSRTAYRSPATHGMAQCRDQTAVICNCRIADIERARREKTQCDCADYKEPPRRINSSCKCADPVLNLDTPIKGTDFDQKTIYPKSPRANKDYPISSRSNIRSPREMIINHIPSSGYQSPAGGLTSRRQNFTVNPVDSYSYRSCGCSPRSKTRDRTPAGHTVAFNSPQRFSSVGREGISGSCGCSNKEIITGDSSKRPRSAFSNWWACKCCDHEAYNLVCPDRCNLDKRNSPSPRATSSKTVCYPCLSLKGDQNLDLSGVQSRKGYEQSPKVNPKSPGRTSARSRYELNHSYSPGNYDESTRSGSRTPRNCRGCDQQPDSTFTTNASKRQSSVSRANFSQSVFTPNADDRPCCATPRSRRAIYEQSTCRNDSQCR